MLFKSALSFSHPERSEPSAEGLVADNDFMVLDEGVGEMGEVVVSIVIASQADDLLFDGARDRVGGHTAGVEVDDPGRAFLLDPLLQALKLTDGNPQGHCRPLIVHGPFENRFNRLIPLCLCHR